MPGRLIILAVLTSALFCCPAIAQEANQEPAQPTLSSNPGADLAMRLRALESMNESAGESLSKTRARMEQMSTFLKSKGLLDEYQAYTDPPKMLPQAMSFNDALQVAIQHEAAMGPATAPEGQDLARQVQAYTNLVRSIWNEYQADMASVQRMTDYMNSKEIFQDYLNWAGEQKASKHQAMVDAASARAKEDAEKQVERTKEVNKDIDEAHARLEKHHQEMLNTAWQHYKFNSKQDLQYYKYSQEYRHGYWNSYGDPYDDVY